MKSLFRHFQTGFISIFIPVILVIYILKIAWPFIEKISKPIARILPFHDLAGELFDFIVGILIIILISIIAGWIVQILVKDRWTKKVESLITQIFPSYSFYKNFTSIANVNWKTAVLEADNSYSMCFVVEELDNDIMLVYIPSTPNTYEGSIAFRKRSDLKMLDISFSDAVKIIREYGVGFSKTVNQEELFNKMKRENKEESKGI